jgi:hypothetical protein
LLRVSNQLTWTMPPSSTATAGMNWWPGDMSLTTTGDEKVRLLSLDAMSSTSAPTLGFGWSA